MNQEEKFTTTINAYIVTGFVWAFVAAVTGFISQLQLYTFWPSSEVVSYGILHPIYTNMLIFGAGLSLFFGASYNILREEEEAKAVPQWLPLLGFGLHQLALGFGLMTLIGSGNDGREFGEMSWIADNFLTLSILVFIITSAISLRGSVDLSYSATLMTLSASGLLITYLLGNFGQPYTITQSTPVFTGIQETALQQFYTMGILGFGIVLPAFTMIFYYFPAYSGIPLASGMSAKFVAWAIAVTVPLAGAATLTYSMAPGVITTIGFAAYAAFFVAILTGAVNQMETVFGSEAASSSNKNDAVSFLLRGSCLLMLVYALVRLVALIPGVQASYDTTFWNVSDLSADMISYGLLAFTGAGIVATQRMNAKEAPAMLSLVQMAGLALGGVLILIGSIMGGLAESSAMSAMTENGELAMKAWSDVFASTGTGRMLSVAGYGLAVIGTLAGMISVFMTQKEEEAVTA